MRAHARILAWSALLLSSSPALAQDRGASFVLVPGVTLWGVSADGNAACGYTETDAVRWTRAGGVEILPKLPGRETDHPYAFSISWDGRTICGTSARFNPRVAWRWTQGEGIVQLPDLPGAIGNTYAQAASGDGRVFAGLCASTGGIGPVFWDSAGAHSPADVTGGLGQAMAVSHSGDFVVAFTLVGLTPQGYRIDSAGQSELLDSELGGFMPMAVSADGGTIAGGVWVGNVSRAGMWTRARGVEHLPGIFDQLTDSLPRGISGDGRVICGDSDILHQFHTAWIWDAHNEAHPLWAVARDQLPQSPGPIDYVKGVSADGRTFVGMPSAASSASYVLRLRAPCAGDVDDGRMTGGRDGAVNIDDLLAFVQWYATGDMRADLDDGTARGVPDAGVTIDDLLYFLGGYAGGC